MIPVAILTGLAFALPIMAYTATRTGDSSFPAINRFIITPLFLLQWRVLPGDRAADVPATHRVCHPALERRVAGARHRHRDHRCAAGGGQPGGHPRLVRGGPVRRVPARSRAGWCSSHGHGRTIDAHPDAHGRSSGRACPGTQRDGLPTTVAGHPVGLLRARVLPAGHRLRAGQGDRRRRRHPLRGVRGAGPAGHLGHERRHLRLDLQPVLQAEVRAHLRRDAGDPHGRPRCGHRRDHLGADSRAHLCRRIHGRDAGAGTDVHATGAAGGAGLGAHRVRGGGHGHGGHHVRAHAGRTSTWSSSSPCRCSCSVPRSSPSRPTPSRSGPSWRSRRSTGVSTCCAA